MRLRKNTVIKKDGGFGSGAFNPLTFDVGNLIALYDGDVDLTTASWIDQSANGYNISWNNSPTIIPNSLNTHQVVSLNGSNQNGVHATIPITQANTIYLVLFQGAGTLGQTAQQSGLLLNPFVERAPSNKLQYQPDSGSTLVSATDFLTSTYYVLTITTGATNSTIRLNNNTTATGTGINLTSQTGMILGARYSPTSGFWNGRFAYYIIRSGQDTLIIQNQFVKFLMERFAL